MHINFEFKASTENLGLLEQILVGLNPIFIGEDHQIDTYFNTNIGRLKMREGNIENALIYKNTIIEFCNFIKNKNIEEMPCELLKEFANSFVIISSIIYNTPQEGTPLKDYLQANNIDINKWIASKSAI
jgi:adenylate cyclase class IV